MSNTGNINVESAPVSYYKVVGARLIKGPDVREIQNLLDSKTRSASGEPDFIRATFEMRLCPSALATNPASGGARTIIATATADVCVVNFQTEIEGCEEFMSDIVLGIKNFSMLLSPPGHKGVFVSREVDEDVEIRYNTNRRTGFVKNIKALA